MALASSALGGFPAVLSRTGQRPRIRVLGTHVTLQEQIRQQAEKDLHIDIEFYPGGSADVIFQASTDPSSFDLYEQWSNSLRILWQANAIQPIDTHRILHWNEVNDLSKKGRLTGKARIGAGDAPYKLLYVQPDGTPGERPSRFISFLPYVHNVDSFGYDTRFVPEGIPYRTESWSWLLNPDFQGKVAIINEPTIGLFDLALAVRSAGLMNFKDIGNMTRKEVDSFFKILLEYKRKGHFRGFWTSVPQSVSLMESRQVVIQSMFSPGVSTLKGKGIPCVFAAPREGYRAWHGVLCLSRNTGGEAKDAAYRFMNWWLSGWPGAFIARQGYYISNPQRSRPFMSEAEWDYWYMGKPAAEPLYGTDGQLSVRPGEVRTGGSYEKRLENIAVWNSVMDTYEYTLLRWNEFLIT